MIRRTDFNRGGEVEDNPVIMGSSSTSPSGLHRLTDLDSKLGLRLRKSLRAVFVSEHSSVFRRALVRQLADEFRMLNSKRDRLLLRIPEHNLAEIRACSVIHMDDSLFASSNGINSPFD